MKAIRYFVSLALFIALAAGLALKEKSSEDSIASKLIADRSHAPAQDAGQKTKRLQSERTRIKEANASTSTSQRAQRPAEKPEEANASGGLVQPDMAAWLAKGEELARFDPSYPSKGKQRTIRLVRTDFKYPLIRVEETTTTGLAAGSPTAQRNYTAMVGDHLTIGLQADADMDRLTAVVASMGMEIREKLNESTIIASFEPSPGNDTLLEKQELLKDYGELIAYVEPDYIVQSHVVPTDPSLLNDGRLWGLYNDGRFGGDSISDIDAENGWNLRKDAPHTIVAVIDTGVRRTHEKLAPNMWENAGESLNGFDDDDNDYVDDIHGYDAYDNDMDPLDENGHGTHVAGTIGASGYNSGGILGVAWNVQIMALRFLGPRGYGVTSDAVRCIDYARLNGARILNNSWGGRGKSHALEAAIQRCAEENILFVASAGNANVDIDVQPHYPAAYPNRNIISVAAHNRKDEPAFFTNRGFKKVDISAPGVDIHSAAFFSDTATKRLSGTSMAAPFVSGILALLDAEFPGAEAHQLMNRLYRGAGKMDPLHRHISRTGSRANLYGSLTTSLDTPPNDHFENASQPAERSWAAWEIDTRGATFESSEPAYTRPAQATGSVWFKFEAHNTNAIRISTEGSEYPTEIFVFDSDTRQLLASSKGQSRFYFEPETAGSYHFAAVNATVASGQVALDIRQAPDNDRRTNARLEEGLFWEVEGENGGASLDFDEFTTWGYAPVDRSVWWKWVAPRNGRFTLSTYGSDFDTVLSAFRSDDNVYLKNDTTHLLFVIDRSKAVQKKYNVIFGFDWNQDGGSADLLDQQIGGIISAIRYWQFEHKYKNKKWDNLKIGIVVFDETTGVVDVNPATPELDVWTSVTADKDADGQYDLMQALRSIRSSELQADFEPALQSATSLLETAQPGAGVCAFFSPALDLAESDFTDDVATFRSSGHGLTAFGPSIGSNMDALLQLDPYAKSYSHHNELRGMLRGMLAVNDDASWYGRWSQITISATEGETYYFGVAGYRGEYGKIQLQGRDPDFPFITEEPVSKTAGISERVSLEVTATGQEPLLYQWYFNGELIPGANSRSYAIWSALPSDAGRYKVEVSNVHGQAVSRTVRLDLEETAPRLTFQPSDTGFIENESLRLVAAAVGTEPITWQWYHDGVALPGGTSPVLEIANATAADAGNYHAVASNVIGSTRSRTAKTTITSAEFNDWKQRTGNFDQEDLNDVAFGNDYFVAVGNNAKVLFTSDVISWDPVEIEASADLNGIAYGNNVFVAAGSNGTVLRGSSPQYWEAFGPDESTLWHGVDYVDGVFWLTGSDGKLMRSLDGENWEMIATGTDADLSGVAYGHDGYLVISKTNTYLRSANAIDWTVHTAESGSSTAAAFRDVTYFSGRYYLCLNGSIQTSDSTNLPQLSTTTNAFIAKYRTFANNPEADSLFAVGGYSSYLGSYLFGKGGRGDSGQIRIYGGSPSAEGAAYGLGYYVSVGAGGQIFRSVDGLSLESGWDITNHTLKDVLYANGIYVASGNKGAIYTSSDGQWWRQVRGEVDTYGASKHADIWTHLIEHQGEIYALSPEGNHGKTTDGLHWEWFSGPGIYRAISDGTHFYFGTGSNLYRSDDMRTASAELLPADTTRDILDLVYGDGIYVLRTYESYVQALWTSTDGLTWTKADSPGSGADMLVHQDGIFLGNDMRWSTDGTNWQKAGVLSHVHRDTDQLAYIVPTEEILNWANAGSGFDWDTVPFGTTFGYDVSGELSFTIPNEGNLEASMHNQNPGLYVRYTLPQFVPQDYLSLTLKTRFNDGLLVYIGNEVVAGQNAAETASWNSQATGSRTVAETETEQIFDLSSSLDFYETYYQRMIAFHVLNHDPSDGLFLFDFELVGLKRLNLENVFASGGTYFGFNEAGELFVSENARDWVRFQPNVGVLRDLIKDTEGFTGVGERGSIFQTRDAARLAPQVYLRQPLVPQNVGIGDPVRFEIEAHASEDDIRDVQLYANQTKIATLTEAPYTFDWIPESFGEFEVFAVATDSSGLASRSASIDVTVAAHEPWRPIGTAVAPGDLNNLERIGDQWVALSTAGRLYFSEDGLNWTPRKVPAEDSLQSIAMADDGTLVAGSAEGGIFISYDDGRNWVEQDRFLNFDLSSLEYRFGRFYFAPNGVLIASTNNHQQWEIVREFNPNSANAPNGHFAYGDGKLMLAMNSEAYVSVDGETWTLYGSIPSGGGLVDRPQGATGLAYSASDNQFYVSYYKEEEVNNYSDAFQGAVARIVPGQMAEEILGLTYYEGTYYSRIHPNFHLNFSASGEGLFIGPRAATFDPSTGIWTESETFSAQVARTDDLKEVRNKALTSHGNNFYLVDESSRVLQSSDGLAWAHLNGEPVNRWQKIRYLQGRYIALGLAGALYTSTDAETWTHRPTGTSARLFDITYGNGRYVIAANGGKLITSTDLIDWSILSPGGSGDFQAVYFANGSFVAAGVDQAYRSQDGLNWNDVTPVFAEDADGFSILNVRYWNDKWFLVGGTYVTGYHGRVLNAPLYYSSDNDGISWAKGSYSGADGASYDAFSDLIYAQGKYLMTETGSRIHISNDLENWTMVAGEGAETKTATHIDGYWYVMCKGAQLIRSSDTIEWEVPVSAKGSTSDPFASGAGPAAGPAGLVISDGTESLLKSTNGYLWEPIFKKMTISNLVGGANDGDSFYAMNDRSEILEVAPQAGLLKKHETTRANQIRYENGLYFAFGYNDHMDVSSDGDNWVAVDFSGIGAPVDVLDIVYDGSRYVAIANIRFTSTLEAFILTSPDGVNWTHEASLAAPNGSYHGIDLNYFDGAYYAGNKRSTDLITWTSLSGPAGYMGYVNGLYLSNGHYSHDGTTWMQATGLGSATDYAYSNGIYLALDGETIYLSEDGITWSASSTAGINLIDVIADGDGFTALASDGSVHRFSLNDLAPGKTNWTQSTYGPGETVEGSFTITNYGKKSWEGSVPVDYEIWITKTGRLFDGTSRRISSGTWQQSLAIGQSAEIALSAILPDDLEASDYYSAVVLDPLSEVLDYNQENNRFIAATTDILIPEWSVNFEISGGGSLMNANPSASSFRHNTSEVFVPMAQKGYTFTGWEGISDPGLGPLTLNFNQNYTVQAVFERAYQLNTSTSGLGSVNASPGGEQFVEGSTVLLYPEPETGWRFEKWTGDAEGSNVPYTWNVDGDLRIKAHFIPDGSESFGAWISSRADSSKRDPNDDGLGNGRANIINYFLGQNGDSEPILNPTLRPTPVGYELNVPFNPDAQNVGFEVLYTTDLDKWFALETDPDFFASEEQSELSYEINKSGDETLFFTVRVYQIE